MLPARINKKADFRQLLKYGKVTRTEYFIVRFIKGDTVRFAVNISKKMAKRANKRNFAKRRLRSLMAQYPPNIPGDYLFSLNKNMITEPFHAIKKSFIETFCEAR